MLGSSLLLVNSSDSSDCEDHESSILAAVRAGALHPHHQDLLQDQVTRSQADQLASNLPHTPAMGQHDPFSRGPAPPGSDVVDELLKPLQSYFSVFRTGQYTGGGLDDMVNGGPPAHNTRSQADKRYRIKKQQEERKKRGERGEVVENGHVPHGPHHPGIPMVTLPMGAPPPMTNGYHHPRLDMEPDMSHLPPPNMAEPPPNMVPVVPIPGQPHNYPPPHITHPLLLPPPVLLSSSPSSGPPVVAPMYQDQAPDQNLDLDISKMSISEFPATATEESRDNDDGDIEQQPVDIEQVAELLTKDLFNLYSLSFMCKSKDLSERRIRLDFGLVAEVRTSKIFSTYT